MFPIGNIIMNSKLNILNKTGNMKQVLNRFYSSLVHSSRYIPRRAIMYVPGDDTRKVRKASHLECDCIALDCEDAVAMNRKQLARESIRAFFDSGANIPPEDCLDKRRKTEWAVRINAVDSGLCEEDLKVLVSGHKPPETILLPKCESAEDLKYFSSNLSKYLNVNAIQHRVSLIFYAESCTSIMNLPDICRAAMEISSKPDSLFDPVGIVFGSDDFCASLGVNRTENSENIIYARQRMVLVAKAFGMQAIDMVHIQFKDLEGLRVQSDIGAQFGFTGKQIIHPDQINIVQKAFLPSQRKVQWANGLLEAFAQHQKAGKGAFVYENQMIDMPTMRQARNIIDIMKTVQ